MNITPPNPRVTVAVPLYHSLRFVDNIVRNLTGFSYPNLEIIISDRHCVDRALDELYRRFHADRRFTFIRATDGVDWTRHYNDLLVMASGKYFLWMPHDDAYPPQYVTNLVESLERTPEAVLAYGHMDSETFEGEVMPQRRLNLHRRGAGPWSPRDARFLFSIGNDAGVAFRGLFRRQMLVDKGLYIMPTIGLVLADVYWLVGVALQGPFCFVDSSRCRKRFYRGSTHTAWRYTLRQRIDGLRVVAAFMRRYCRSRWQRVEVMLYFIAWTVRRRLDIRHALARRIARLWRRHSA